MPSRNGNVDLEWFNASMSRTTLQRLARISRAEAAGLRSGKFPVPYSLLFLVRCYNACKAESDEQLVEALDDLLEPLEES